jgi:hypothetical protein
VGEGVVGPFFFKGCYAPRIKCGAGYENLDFVKFYMLQQEKEYKMGIKGRVDKMVVMACEECKERNYTTTKNKKNIK